MFTVNDLVQRYGLTANQVRDRLTMLEGLLDGHIIRGRQNAKLLTDAGLAIFDRLLQLERDGIPAATAVSMMKDERLKDQNTMVNLDQNDGHTQELIQELRAQVQDLRQERDRLLKLIEDLQARIPALPSSEPRRSWWARLWGR
ncbi:MAG: hypothetical protein ABIL70_09790 [candidate division WOR-3 bacterium]